MHVVSATTSSQTFEQRSISFKILCVKISDMCSLKVHLGRPKPQSEYGVFAEALHALHKYSLTCWKINPTSAVYISVLETPYQGIYILGQCSTIVQGLVWLSRVRKEVESQTHLFLCPSARMENVFLALIVIYQQRRGHLLTNRTEVRPVCV